MQHQQLLNLNLIRKLPLALFIAFTSLHIIDAVMTRTAVRLGYKEKMPFTKKLIEELGLDKAMMFRSLMFILFSIVLVMAGWHITELALFATILFTIFVIYFLCVTVYDSMQLLKGYSGKTEAALFN
jgi:hypothetical protein